MRRLFYFYRSFLQRMCFWSNGGCRGSDELEGSRKEEERIQYWNKVVYDTNLFWLFLFVLAYILERLNLDNDDTNKRNGEKKSNVCISTTKLSYFLLTDLSILFFHIFHFFRDISEQILVFKPSFFSRDSSILFIPLLPISFIHARFLLVHYF